MCSHVPLLYMYMYMTNEMMQDMAQLLYSNTSIIIAILIVTERVVKQAAAHAQYTIGDLGIHDYT